MQWLVRRDQTFRTLPTGILVLLVAAAILFPGMAEYGMWFDEVNMVQATTFIHSPADLLANRPGLQGHPPLFFIVFKVWITLVGQTDFALRAMIALSALLTAAIVYRITVDLTDQALGGAFAVLALVTMGFFWQYAHTTHNYMFFTLLVTLLLFFHVRYWFGSGRPVYLVAAFLTLVALLYTHYHAIYIIGALAIHAFLIGLRRFPKLVRWGGIHVAAGLLFVPWLPRLTNVYNDHYLDAVDMSRTPASAPTSWKLVDIIINTLLYDGGTVYGAALLIGLVLVLAFPLRNRRYSLSVVGLLVAFLGLGLGISLLGNIVVETLAPRRGIFLLVGVAIGIGYALAHLPRPLALAGIGAVIVLTPNFPMPVSVGGNWPYRDTIAYVAEQVEPDDMLFIYYGDLFTGRPMRYYAKQFLPEGVPYVNRLTETAHVQNLAWARKRLWVIWEDKYPLDKWQGLLAQKQYQEVDRTSVNGYWLSLFEDTASPDALPAPDDAILANASILPQTFGGVFTLTDYRVSQTTVQPGDTLTVWLAWQIQRPVAEEHSVFVHFIEDDLVTLHGQDDNAPTHLGYELPTNYWPAGTTIYDQHTFTIDADTPPGTYNLRIGIYDHVHFGRYTAVPGDATGVSDGVILTTIDVTAGG